MIPAIWIAIIIFVFRLLAFYAVAIFVPAILIKLTRRTLTIWTAAAVSSLCVVLPMLAILNNDLVISDFYQVFYIWGISGSLFRILTWTFTTGAVVSYFYAGSLVWFFKSPTYSQILLFTWLGMLLNCIAMIGIPYLLFDKYGIRVAYDNSVFLGTALVLTSAVTFYILRSKNCKTLISD